MCVALGSGQGGWAENADGEEARQRPDHALSSLPGSAVFRCFRPTLMSCIGGVDSEGVPCCWPCAQVSLKFTKYWWVWADEFQASALVWVPGNTHLPLHPQLSTSQALEPEYSAPVALGKSSLFLCLSFFICEMGQ